MIDKIIALDDGHGMETQGKRTPVFEDGSFMKENEFNRAVVKYLDDELKRCGFKTLLVAECDTDIPLQTRTNLANNIITNKYNRQADLYISVHANACTGNWGNWGGIETYIYTYTDSVTEEIANIIHKNLIKGTPLKDRGVKRGNFHVLRETAMPAVLVECGFMDNREEAKLLMSEKYRKECATEIAQAICEVYGVDYIKENNNIKQSKLTPIMLTPITCIREEVKYKMISYVLNNNSNPNLPYCTLEELVDMYMEEGECEKVRSDIAFAQAIKETGFFKYGGIVNPDMNNFAGIGALNNNENGNAARFDTPRLGVRVHIQHLKAYACGEELNKECVDPRFNLVKRAASPFVEWLGAEDNPYKIGWAYPGKGYGDDILKILSNISKEPSKKIPQWQIDAFNSLKAKKIITDDNYWNRLNDNITIGECMALLDKVSNVVSDIVEDNILTDLINATERMYK